jgi:DNA-binding CsgD family transcriptional regulator
MIGGKGLLNHRGFARSYRKGIVARKHFFQRLWERFRRALSPEPLPGHTGPSHRYQLDTNLLDTLHGLARTEQRPVGDVANDLLVSGLAQRRARQELWQCWLSLTPREKDVTALICLSYTTPQIAARLYIAPSTVKTHACNALLKFAAKNRNDLRSLLSDWDFSQWNLP